MKQTIKNNLHHLPIIIITGVMIFFAITTTKCKSFEPVIIKNQSGKMDKERSDYYTVIKFYALSGATDAAHIGTVYNSVKEADKRERLETKKNKCKKLYFGENPISKEDRDQYNLYIDCISK